MPPRWGLKTVCMIAGYKHAAPLALTSRCGGLIRRQRIDPSGSSGRSDLFIAQALAVDSISGLWEKRGMWQRTALVMFGVSACAIAFAAESPLTNVPRVTVNFSNRLGPMRIDQMSLGQGGLSDAPMWNMIAWRKCALFTRW